MKTANNNINVVNHTSMGMYNAVEFATATLSKITVRNIILDTEFGLIPIEKTSGVDFDHQVEVMSWKNAPATKFVVDHRNDGNLHVYAQIGWRLGMPIKFLRLEIVTALASCAIRYIFRHTMYEGLEDAVVYAFSESTSPLRGTHGSDAIHPHQIADLALEAIIPSKSQRNSNVGDVARHAMGENYRMRQQAAKRILRKSMEVFNKVDLGMNFQVEFYRDLMAIVLWMINEDYGTRIDEINGKMAAEWFLKHPQGNIFEFMHYLVKG